MPKQRHYILDIGRIIAVLAVMLYHYFTGHINDVPYGDCYSILPFGYLGARYFFILTGFFIYENLQKKDTLLLFWRKKFIRLWIPLVICSMVTFVFAHLMSTVYSALPYQQTLSWKNLLFSCTFLEPGTINLLLDTDFRYINGGYWFLSAEIEFLVIISLCYYIKREWFFPIYGSVSLLCVLANHWTHALVYTDYLQYFIWGMIFYLLYNRSPKKIWWLLPSAITPLLIDLIKEIKPEHLYILIILLLWALYVTIGNRINLSTDKLAKISQLSKGVYETFLLHEVIGILCIHQYAPLFGTYMWILPIMLIAALFPIGALVHRLNQFLINRVSRFYGRGLISNL